MYLQQRGLFLLIKGIFLYQQKELTYQEGVILSFDHCIDFTKMTRKLT